MEDHQSVECWRRESQLSIERSRARREQSPHPWPAGALEWAVALAVAVTFAGVAYGFLVFFGIGTWS